MILGMKVRKQDLEDMLKFNPSILEFHFSDSDLYMELNRDFDQHLIVHCYEYFEKKLLDIVSSKDTNQVHSQEKTIELIQKAIDKTVSLNEHFIGKPTIIVHPGGYTLTEPNSSEINKMQNSIVDAIKKLDYKNVNFLLENMPPYAWFFGGRWICNVFLNGDEIIKYCKETNLQICFDLCHSQLYCNKTNLSLVDEFKKIENHVDYFHLSDADGVDGEGLSFGKGNLPFKEIIPLLNRHLEKGFSIEVWKGHENGGKGFKDFLEMIKQNGLIVN